MADNIKLRNGTAAAWDSADPTLLLGERGLETDTLLAKTGDGSTAWGSLPYDDYGLSAAKVASYTILDADANFFEMTTGASDRTLTLPTLADNQDRVIDMVKVDSGAGIMIVDGEGAETIDGATTFQLPSQYNNLRVRAGVSTWHVISMKANFDTGWVANSDWTNAELTVTHGLNTPVSELVVKFFVSTDGTEANSFEMYNITWAVNSIADLSYGHEIIAIGDTSFKIQTGASGMIHLDDAGVRETIAAQSWQYKVKVYRLL